MKKILIVVLIIFFTTTAFAENSSEVVKGKELHAKILSSYPRLDSFYQLPDLTAALTSSPKVAIYLPSDAWNELPQAKRKWLAAYVESLIDSVRANPLRYAHVPSSAPAASATKRNLRKMSSKDWQIIAGQLTNNGRDILSDTVVLSGN